MTVYKLTPKQENFCLKYIETGNASEAYRQSYNTEKMKPASVNRLGKKEYDKVKIRSRIDELKAELSEEFKYTMVDAMTEYEEARQLALIKSNPAAMVTATNGKVNITGLEAPKTVNVEGTLAEWLAGIQDTS